MKLFVREPLTDTSSVCFCPSLLLAPGVTHWSGWLGSKNSQLKVGLWLGGRGNRVGVCVCVGGVLWASLCNTASERKCLNSNLNESDGEKTNNNELSF